MIGDWSVFEHFSEREQELFARGVNTLISGGFILDMLDRDKPLYRFILSHEEAFDTYLGLSGWSLRKDESLGVIAIKGPGIARFSLNLEETIGLLVVRVLYEEKRLEISLARERTVLQSELQDRYRVLSDRAPGKTRFVNMLRRFRTLRLIAIKGEETDPDSLIILYPSIVFALDGESIDEAHDRLKKLKSAAADTYEETENIDEDTDPDIFSEPERG
ncbi:MAG: DUF4194 domain-containing protein [Spirochaetales bacterium]|nr:DUF4194 domain-containing protein [Spirochaetales bacterium]